MFQAGCSMRLPESYGLVFQVACNTGYLKKFKRKRSISPALLPAISSMPKRLTRREEMKHFRCI
mgnify:CR=1 FL=1